LCDILNRSNKESPWFKKWFDEWYLKLYCHRDLKDARQQVDLIIKTLRLNKTDPILDLGCGDGRHLHLLDKDGYCTFGLDLSEKLLREGNRIYGPLRVMVGDMRYIPGRFQVILSLFTSFGYFETENEDRQALMSISQSLNEGGWFWLDFLTPEYVKNNLAKETVTCLENDFRVFEQRNLKGNRVVKDIRFCRGGQEWTYHETVRLYTRSELELLLFEAGIKPQGCFGDYKGSNWTANAHRTIIYGRKIA